MATNAQLVDLINIYIADDPLIDNHELSVNLTTEGKIIAYWARRPSRRKIDRYKEITRRARAELAERAS